MGERTVPPERAKRVSPLGVLNSVVMVLTLVVSLAVQFNGTARQDRFEVTRANCIAQLTDYLAVLFRIRAGSAQVNPDFPHPEIPALLATETAVTAACLDSKLIDREVHPLEDEWYSFSRSEIMTTMLANPRVTPTLIESEIWWTKDLLATAIAAPKPSILPWVSVSPMSIISSGARTGN